MPRECWGHSCCQGLLQLPGSPLVSPSLALSSCVMGRADLLVLGHTTAAQHDIPSAMLS